MAQRGNREACRAGRKGRMVHCDAVGAAGRLPREMYEIPTTHCDTVGAARRAARLMHEIPTTHCDTVGAARRAARLMHGLSIPAPYGRTKTGAAVSPGHPVPAKGDHLPGQMVLNGQR